MSEIGEEKAQSEKGSDSASAEEASLSDFIVSHYEGTRDKTGCYDGEGQVSFSGGNTYQGSLSKGAMHGRGKYTWNDGMSYDGEMINNEISGFGRYQWKDKSFYEGEVFNGLRHGVGVFKSTEHGVSYSGQWCLGKRHGRGIMHYNEHSWYEGDWVNNNRHGWGVRRYHTGNVYEGQWINDKRHGDGTMRWLTTNESYTGMWENGVQHGYGTHTWYLNRVPGSQYPLRNEYVGDFVNGLRHGHGKFFFASGAVYDGEWENSKKHGWGKFIFKNGRVFEGQFENDHMIDYPNLELDASDASDAPGLTLDSVMEGKLTMSNDGCGNVLGPNLTIDIDFILENIPRDQREHELKQVTFLMIRNISLLRRVYSFYSALGHDRSPDNTFVMTRFQFWRFLKDCRLHHYTHSLASLDRSVAHCNVGEDVHNPMEKILLREFLSTCIIISYILFEGQVNKNPDGKASIIAACLQWLIEEHLIKFSCQVGGYFLFEPRRAVTALAYMDRSWQIFQKSCTKRVQTPHDSTLTMRQFLFLLQDLKIIGNNLPTATVLKILAVDDPTVSDGETCNMELEMTFLEFFEAVVGCALQYNSLQESETNAPSPVNLESVKASSIEPIKDVFQGVTNESHVENYYAPKSGQFLQTLSQFTAPDKDHDSLKEANNSQVHNEEMTSPHEAEFSNWTKNLNFFFMHCLFPAWNKVVALRSEAARSKASTGESIRMQRLEFEAERRWTIKSNSPVTSTASEHHEVECSDVPKSSDELP
uniref:Radial spoke head 10 homolog B-like n=1 Tax=Phallusia mammillata TaxID=59560 RepID=A0A6F9DQT5_9ASCI|nr:radial spoke head 10 homolog B-like [Phallusia mammillata]